MFLSRARSMDIGGTRVPILDVEDLVIAKVLAGRPKDIDDAQALWRVHGSDLNAERIRSVLAELEQALAQSELLPAFAGVANRGV
jgi:predicted nucleotidyltransferase